MAQCCRVRSCTLTDVVPATLDNLLDNVGKLPPTAAPCRVASLDWCAPRAFLDVEERAPDLILGADLVYEPTLAAPLAATLDALLSRAAREARVGVTPRALIACVPARSKGPGSQPRQPLTALAALSPACSGLLPWPEKSARGALVPSQFAESTAFGHPRCAAHRDLGPLRERAQGARAHACRLHGRGARSHGSGRVPVLVRGRRGGTRASAGG